MSLEERICELLPGGTLHTGVTLPLPPGHSTVSGSDHDAFTVMGITKSKLNCVNILTIIICLFTLTSNNR